MGVCMCVCGVCFLVVSSWLFACATSGAIVPIDQHLVTPPPNTRAEEDLVRAECKMTEEAGSLIEREYNEQGPPPAEEEREREEDKDGGDPQEGKGTEERESVLAGVVVCLHKKISDQSMQVTPQVHVCV